MLPLIRFLALLVVLCVLSHCVKAQDFDYLSVDYYGFSNSICSGTPRMRTFTKMNACLYDGDYPVRRLDEAYKEEARRLVQSDTQFLLDNYFAEKLSDRPFMPFISRNTGNSSQAGATTQRAVAASKAHDARSLVTAGELKEWTWSVMGATRDKILISEVNFLVDDVAALTCDISKFDYRDAKFSILPFDRCFNVAPDAFEYKTSGRVVADMGYAFVRPITQVPAFPDNGVVISVYNWDTAGLSDCQADSSPDMPGNSNKKAWAKIWYPTGVCSKYSHQTDDDAEDKGNYVYTCSGGTLTFEIFAAADTTCTGTKTTVSYSVGSGECATANAPKNKIFDNDDDEYLHMFLPNPGMDEKAWARFDCVSATPTMTPTAPSYMPTVGPTTEPTLSPSVEPTYSPSVQPSTAPTTSPTFLPTKTPKKGSSGCEDCVCNGNGVAKKNKAVVKKQKRM